jgi:cytochrome c5
MNIGIRVTSYAVLPLCILAIALKPNAAVEASVATPQTSVPARFLSVMPASGNFVYAMQAAPAPDTTKKADDDPLPEGKGKDVTKKVCSGCHAVSMFASQRHDHEQWSAIIDQMVGKGLDASDDQLNQINDYLATYLGPKKDSDTSQSK